MNFKELCRARYSARRYKNTPIPTETMAYLKECVRMAPSAVNYQPWIFIEITSNTGREKLQQCYEREWFCQAPMYILACKNSEQAWTRRYDNKNHADIDLAIAIQHLCLAATEQGLGTCWVCNFNIQLCSELLNLPQHLEPVAIIPIGFPDAEDPNTKNRKTIEEIWQSE